MIKDKKILGAREIALYGLFIALVYIATRFINIPGPTSGGLFHLGNVMAFTIAMVFGKKAGAISGAFGMALFDLTSSFVIWAPFTFVIRFAMGYIIGYLVCADNNSKVRQTINIISSLVIATIIMIAGYYFTEVLIYGNWIAPIQSIWGNFMQCVVGSIIAVPVAVALRAGFKVRHIELKI